MTIRGLLTRAASVFCAGLAALMAGAAPASAQIRLDTYVTGLSLPLEFVQDPAEPTVQYVVEQGGLIRIIVSGTLQPTPFLNAAPFIVSGGEQGLLGLAFAPDYATSGRFFVDFTDPAGNTVVARFKRSAADPRVADPATRFDLRWGGAGGQRFIVQPFSNHNGGHLLFGPDGYLYVALGDGGSGGDPQNNSQNPMSFLGKLLRIDVRVADSDPNGYVVPADNPFVNGTPIAALPEIWAFGLRNPWKFTFDDPAHGGSGAMLIGDVGQASFEEVDYQAPGVGGRNYGWRIREGLHAYDPSQPAAYTPLIDPILEYDHSQGDSITGGYVYRGSAMRPMYQGRYFYGDFVSGRLWSVSLTTTGGGGVTASAPLDHGPEVGGAARIGNPSAFGVDAAGEMYLVSYTAGTILKIVDTQYTLSVSVQGSGTVVSTDAAIHCPSACSQLYASGAQVTLQAAPLTGFVFGGWSPGNCGSGIILMDTVHSCTATFLARGTGAPKPGTVSLSGSAFGDAFTYNPRTGERTVEINDGQGHFNEIRGAWSANWQVYPADFNGDGLTDFFTYNPESGQWYKAINNGQGDFTYFAGQWSSGWQVFIVDLNGDHHSDAFVYNRSTGDWYRCLSTGAGTGDFAYVGGTWSANWDIYPVDFNGDGNTDLFLYNPPSGLWFQVINDGVSGFQYRSGLWSAGWTITPGDFNGDGRTDLFVQHPATGEHYVVTTQSTLDFTYGYGVWSPEWTVTPGDFNGDGKTDLFLYNRDLGWWYEAISDGAGNFGLAFGIWAPQWQVQVTDLNGDGHSDVLLYNASSGRWYQAINTGVGAFSLGTGVWDPGLTIIGSVPR